jgi:hypothetical protein
MIARSLRAITRTMPGAEGFAVGFIGLLRALALGGAAVWSIVLAWKIAGLAAANVLRRCAATFWVGLAASTGAASGAVYFWTVTRPHFQAAFFPP